MRGSEAGAGRASPSSESTQANPSIAFVQDGDQPSPVLLRVALDLDEGLFASSKGKAEKIVCPNWHQGPGGGTREFHEFPANPDGQHDLSSAGPSPEPSSA